MAYRVIVSDPANDEIDATAGYIAVMAETPDAERLPTAPGTSAILSPVAEFRFYRTCGFHPDGGEMVSPALGTVEIGIALKR